MLIRAFTKSTTCAHLKVVMEHCCSGNHQNGGHKGKMRRLKKHSIIKKIFIARTVSLIMSSLSELSLPRTRIEAFEFARTHGLVPTRPYCKTKYKGHKDHPELFSHYFYGETDLGIYRCPKSKKCRPHISVAENTWFENSHLSPEKEFRVLFGHAHNESYERISLGVGENLSSSTLAARMRYCREMVTNAFTQMVLSLSKIGGPGIVVQIDESKFGQRKNNRGQIVEGHWVLGLIAQDSDDLRLIVCPDNKRNAHSLIPLIEQHVQRGSIIHTQ